MADSWEDMNDEEFLNTLDDIDNYEPGDDNVEDTDQVDDGTTSENTDIETDNFHDDEGLENESEELNDEPEMHEENTQEANSDDGSDGSEAETGEGEEDGDVGSESDGKTALNYEDEYKKILGERDQLRGFYDEVTSEFIANGKKVRGFDDPKKIIQAQQMAAGFADKMAGFKKYKPFIGTLKEKGFLEDPDKFNFAMQLLDGDPEALKQQMKNLEIDPVEMDMEDINFQPQNQLQSDIGVAFDELVENAGQRGVDQQVRQVVAKDWDDDSVIELLNDPQSSNDLVSHISSGVYDVVQDRMSEKKRTDYNNVYTSKPMIEQYREAASELEGEYVNYMQQKQVYDQQMAQMQQNQQYGGNGMQQQYAEPVANGQAEEYRRKVELQNAEAAKARKKASSVSRRKPKTKNTVKSFDPNDLSDSEMDQILDGLIVGQ